MAWIIGCASKTPDFADRPQTLLDGDSATALRECLERGLQAAHPSPFAADVHDARSLALPEAA